MADYIAIAFVGHPNCNLSNQFKFKVMLTKKIPSVLFVFLLLGSVSVAQTTRIVDANPARPNGPNYYATLQAAIDAAVDGDNILVTPHASTYTGTLNKRLHFVGPGLDVSKNDYRVLSRVSLLISSVNATGSSLKGLYISNIQQQNYQSSGSSTISISECYAQSLYSTTNSSMQARINYDIRNSLVHGGILSGTIQNSVIWELQLQHGTVRNNIIWGTLQFGANYDNSTPNQIRVNVYNNILMTNSITANHTSFTRNVFDRVYSPNLVNTAVTFSDNITGEELDPRFIQGSLNDLATNAGFNLPNGTSFTGNYRLAANSPGKGYGTDGSDVGIYGGTYPFEQLDRGLVVLPSVRRLNVSGVVREGGEIRIEATVSNATSN